jgi:hypothetical protein
MGVKKTTYVQILVSLPLMQDTVRAFFGLCYARGMLGSSKFDARLLWNPSFYGPVFAATMGLNR